MLTTETILSVDGTEEISYKIFRVESEIMHSDWLTHVT